jgi:hypothetical protein
MAFESVVDLLDEGGEGEIGILISVNSEKVVEEYIDHDPGETSPFLREKLAGLQKRLLLISEAVEVPIHHDPVDVPGRIVVGEGLRSALHEIAEEIADARGVGGPCQVEMGEIVHGERTIFGDIRKVANPRSMGSLPRIWQIWFGLTGSCSR